MPTFLHQPSLKKKKRTSKQQNIQQIKLDSWKTDLLSPVLILMLSIYAY